MTNFLGDVPDGNYACDSVQRECLSVLPLFKPLFAKYLNVFLLLWNGMHESPVG